MTADIEPNSTTEPVAFKSGGALAASCAPCASCASASAGATAASASAVGEARMLSVTYSPSLGSARYVRSTSYDRPASGAAASAASAASAARTAGALTLASADWTGAAALSSCNELGSGR